jgi:hypothetical protein
MSHQLEGTGMSVEKDEGGAGAGGIRGLGADARQKKQGREIEIPRPCLRISSRSFYFVNDSLQKIVLGLSTCSPRNENPFAVQPVIFPRCFCCPKKIRFSLCELAEVPLMSKAVLEFEPNGFKTSTLPDTEAFVFPI